jgi:hypothetical protein
MGEVKIVDPFTFETETGNDMQNKLTNNRRVEIVIDHESLATN